MNNSVIGLNSICKNDTMPLKNLKTKNPKKTKINGEKDVKASKSKNKKSKRNKKEDKNDKEINVKDVRIEFKKIKVKEKQRLELT